MMLRVGHDKPHIFTSGFGRRAWRYVSGYGVVCIGQWKKLDLFQSSREFTDRVWEMDLTTPDFKGYIRFVAFKGERNLVLWSWWDAHVVYPTLKLWCRVLNWRNRLRPDAS